MGGHAMASGNEDAPGQIKQAEETESDDILQESEEESTEDSDDSAGAETEEAEEEEVADEEETQEFRSSDDGGSSDASASKSSGSQSGGSDDKSSSTSQSSSDFVESAEDCPNEKNRFGEFTGNGANTSGAYDSTCDGRPSENGNGSGGGRPCMGCVGNADNKNPKGQFPNGSDANNGYECDGNNGVGKGNPAHTDCQPTVTENPPTCPDGRPMPPSGVCDKPVKRPPLPDVIKRPSLPPDRVLPRQPFARPPEVPKWKPRQRIQGVLPVTGPSQLLPYVWVALSLIAAGIAALLTDRRRRELGARDW